jgi:ribonuclease D
MSRVAHQFITTDAELADFCQAMSAAPTVAFDTEFVSEHTYRPQLCLVQVAAGQQFAVIDPLAVGDMTPFWRTLVEGDREVVVHAGREEMSFCLDAVDRQPERLIDVQLAAGLIGMEYPAGYGNLISRLLGKTAHKAETRTDWRKRPLSDRQIAYAVDDVRYLLAIRDALRERLTDLGRTAWLTEEMDIWKAALLQSLGEERWRRVGGSSTLSGRSLAIVRELWRWRDAEARQRNRPARQILRDDLIVELAKRRSSDGRQIAAIRGFERGDLRRAIPAMSAAIRAALEMPEDDLPRLHRRESNQHLAMVGQFLNSALTSLCRTQQVAPSLVGTVEDVRELVAYRLADGANGAELPALMRGWRARVVGQLLDDLLAGKVAIRIQDPLSDHPLSFERVEE